MNKKIWIGIGIIALLVIIAAIGIGLGGTDNGDDGKKPQTGQEQDAAVQSGTADDVDSDADNSQNDADDSDGSDDQDSDTDDESHDSNDSDDKDSSNDSDKDAAEDSAKEDSDNKDADNDSADADVDDGKMTYEKYVSMAAEDQQAYFETFEDPADFFDWYNAEKKKYDEAHKDDSVSGGSIDLGDYID